MTDYLLAMLESATPERPLSIKTAIKRLWFEHREVANERSIKAAIAELRERRHFIGANRQPPYGYYLARTPAEQERALGPYKRQVWTSMRIMRGMGATKAQVREVAEQMLLEVDG